MEIAIDFSNEKNFQLERPPVEYEIHEDPEVETIVDEHVESLENNKFGRTAVALDVFFIMVRAQEYYCLGNCVAYILRKASKAKVSAIDALEVDFWRCLV